ncbi:hypothetical protein [Prochlorococcus marinus]|uniref:Hypothetical membrane protein n=1 Tax=Prochlorococcus marinus (strain MIT 9211) TaxID=93059 RepID=A9BAA5_PROM4|nr:hypothetical protein [Prochlorococcus marinus]ABX08767.1 hypothetical membrane protein [Prochlorococcus marinus str. MIT 9211]
MAMSEGSASQKQMSEAKDDKRSKRKPTSLKRKDSKRLPWWIELFFVQLGLPENLLLKILDLKKKSQSHFSKNIRIYKIIPILILAILYSKPIFKQANNNNLCVKKTIEFLDRNDYETSNNIASAVHYCNGGNMTNFLD